MAAENPSLKNKVIDKYAEVKGKFNNWKAEKIAALKTNLKGKWTKFQLKFPRASMVFRRITINRVTRGIGKFVQSQKTRLINGGKGLVAAFFIGKYSSAVFSISILMPH